MRGVLEGQPTWGMVGALATEAATDRHGEANVEFNLRLRGPLANTAIDAYSDDVLDALEKHAADLALGPAALVDFDEPSISLEFFVLADTPAEVHQKLAAIAAILEREVDLPLSSTHTTVNFTGEPVQPEVGSASDRTAGGSALA
jgi:hypothetical protein